MLFGAIGLVFGDFRDGAHRALFDALAACDAGVLVRYLGYAAGNFQNLLWTRIDADSAADALVGVDNRMSHRFPFHASSNLSERKIPLP